MALITAQLLFVERIDEGTIRLDVVVLDREQTPVSPAIGAGLAFDFLLPRDPDYRAEVAATLARWADAGATVELTLLAWRRVTQILVVSGSESILLIPPHAVA